MHCELIYKLQVVKHTLYRIVFVDADKVRTSKLTVRETCVSVDIQTLSNVWNEVIIMTCVESPLGS